MFLSDYELCTQIKYTSWGNVFTYNAINSFFKRREAETLGENTQQCCIPQMVLEGINPNPSACNVVLNKKKRGKDHFVLVRAPVFLWEKVRKVTEDTRKKKRVSERNCPTAVSHSATTGNLIEVSVLCLASNISIIPLWPAITAWYQLSSTANGFLEMSPSDYGRR